MIEFIPLGASLAANAALAVILWWVLHRRPADYESRESEHAGELDTIDSLAEEPCYLCQMGDPHEVCRTAEEHYAGEAELDDRYGVHPNNLPPVDEWERQRAAEQYPASGAIDPDATAILDAAWAQQRPVEVPVVAPIVGRHRPETVDRVDPNWWPVDDGCAQYPRAVPVS
jgi:hypothetical protein